MASRIEQLLQLTQGERLARARKVAGMSQEEMATALGRHLDLDRYRRGGTGSHEGMMSFTGHHVKSGLGHVTRMSGVH